ncbi:hypothetical protein [Actinophytocola sp.]|jgi:histidinol phosphatase-like enzyme|uniref:hypothetical protein n=1 Tax=Actinophytocola sp. TaxID=1872138 RepID=UPI002ED9B405
MPDARMLARHPDPNMVDSMIKRWSVSSSGEWLVGPAQDSVEEFGVSEWGTRGA